MPLYTMTLPLFFFVGFPKLAKVMVVVITGFALCFAIYSVGGVGAAMILILTNQDPLIGLNAIRPPVAEHRGYRSGQCFYFRASQWAQGAAHHGCGRRLKAFVRVGGSRWFKASD